MSTGKKGTEKGLAKRVVPEPLAGVNHVYCDSFYSSAPLVDMLAKDQISLAGTN